MLCGRVEVGGDDFGKIIYGREYLQRTKRVYHYQLELLSCQHQFCVSTLPMCFRTP